jgi:hypothetical protein
MTVAPPQRSSRHRRATSVTADRVGSVPFGGRRQCGQSECGPTTEWSVQVDAESDVRVADN